MRFEPDDGGRAAAGFRGNAGDCATRAIAIATGMPYREVYDLVNDFAKDERYKRGRVGFAAATGRGSSARTGVLKQTMRAVMDHLGWTFTPTMGIGTGCTVHLTDGELPMGRLIVSVSKHYTAVIDGVIHDTHDPQREVHAIEPDTGRTLKPGEWRNVNGICSIRRRCVYGYFQQRS